MQAKNPLSILKICSLLLYMLVLAGCGGSNGSTSSGFSQHESSEYVLPYASGSTHLVGQGNSTDGSHEAGSDQAFAYDFDMPIGTLVVASRSGRVVAIEQRFSDNDHTPGHENFIVIQHSDGTVSGYYHLTQNGVLVDLGSNVQQGDVIARSGNTGDSSEPHLHFEVLECFDCDTIPVGFSNTRPHANGLVENESYTAEKNSLD